MVLKHGPRLARRAIALAGLVAFLTACSNPFNSAPDAALQRTAELARGTMIASVNATGAIQPEAEVRLAFQQSGTVTEVNVDVGSSVKRGDVLARLDTADLQAAVDQANAAVVVALATYSRTIAAPSQADVDAAQAALDAANAGYSKTKAGADKADVDAAEAAVRNAEAALKQAQTAYDLTYRINPAGIGASPVGVQLQQARNNLDAAKSNYDRAVRGADKAQLAAAVQQIEAARAQLAKVQQPVRQSDVDAALAQVKQAQVQVQQAQRRLDLTVLRAPVDGVVSAVNVKAGEATGVLPAVTLLDLSILHIDVTVDEIDIAKLKQGQDVVVTLDALPEAELHGQVDRILPSSTNVSGVVSYAVRVVLDKGAAGLRPGMTANTSIVLEKHEDVVLAPNWAVRRDKATGKSYLTIKVDEKTAREIEVQTGLRNETSTEIVLGADAGQVILAPQTTNSLMGPQ
jgi:HlyD family secretion protein